MKRTVLLILLVVAMHLVMGMLLVSCKQHPVSGYVVGKKHIPAHNIIQYNPCLHMHQTRHVREQWVVYVADSCGVTPCHVTPETFDRLKKGQFVASNGFE